MNIDSIIDILFIIGAIALGFFPGIKKMLGEDKTPKKVVRPVYREPEEEEQEEVRPKRSKKAPVAPPQPEQDNEYFSYETMSERDFEQAFTENVEENAQVTTATETPHPNVQLTMDEEDVYKGVIWSEILKRKY